MNIRSKFICNKILWIISLLDPSILLFYKIRVISVKNFFPDLHWDITLGSYINDLRGPWEGPFFKLQERRSQGTRAQAHHHVGWGGWGKNGELMRGLRRFLDSRGSWYVCDTGCALCCFLFCPNHTGPQPLFRPTAATLISLALQLQPFLLHWPVWPNVLYFFISNWEKGMSDEGKKWGTTVHVYIHSSSLMF